MGSVVGREAELGAVASFLVGVPAGPTALVVEGQAGIGKTTVWLEAIRVARSRSFRVLRSRRSAKQNFSYAALADLVGDAFDE